MAEPRPTEELLNGLHTHMLEVWGKCHTKFETVDSFIWRTFPLWRPDQEGRPELRPSTAANIVDAAANNQLAYEPKIKVIPSDTRPAREQIEKDRADKLEPFLKAVMDDASMYEANLPWKAMGKYGVAYGYFVCDAPRLDLGDRPTKPRKGEGESKEDFEDRQALYEAQGRDWNPIRIAAPHPSRVLLDPAKKHPKEGLRLRNYYAKDLQDLSIRKKATRVYADVWDYQENGKKPYEKIDCLEHWTEQWHTLMEMNGKIIFAEKNTWGFNPLLHAFANWGMEKTNQEGNNPENLAVGILEHVMDTLKAQAQSWSAEHNLQQEAAWALIGTSKDATEFANQRAQGGILEGKEEDYWVARTKDVKDWMLRVDEKYAQDIEDGTFIKPIRGGREPGVTTMGQHAMQLQAAQRRFRVVQEQLNQVASIVAGRILRLVEIYTRQNNTSIAVRGFVINADDIAHNYAVRVTFELVDPIIQMQARQVGMQEVAAGLKSPESYREFDMRAENEGEEIKRLAKAKAMNHPAMAEITAAKGFELWGMKEAYDGWKKQQEFAAQAEQAGGSPRVETRQGLSEQTAKPPQPQMGSLFEEKI